LWLGLDIRASARARIAIMMRSLSNDTTNPKPKSKPSPAATLSRGLNLRERIALREIEKILLKLPPERRMNLIEDLQQRRRAQKAALHHGAA